MPHKDVQGPKQLECLWQSVTVVLRGWSAIVTLSSLSWGALATFNYIL